jgi:transcriptional regulator with XRE-family HTH domain
MAEREYELTFEVSQLSEAVEDQVVDATAATVGVFRGSTLVTLSTHGASALVAATNARLAIENAGASVVRCVEDLVTLRDIAGRLGVTPQAVGNWARGERQGSVTFPHPYVFAGGGLWLWTEVLAWVRTTSPKIALGVDEGLTHPSRADLAAINGQIESARRARDAGWIAVDESYETFGVAETAPARSSYSQPAPKLLGIELAA